jgi:transcriptional regulator with PAS, ATPase and Fis domain
MILDEEIIGESPALKQVLAEAKRLAATVAAVLIAGETGSGKNRSPEPYIV